MDRVQQRALEILRELDARPAAPFYEDAPAQFIFDAIEKLGVDVRRDAYGNIIAHYVNNPDSSQPPIAFVAHMDHPGFEIIEVGDRGIVAKALGGVPVASLKNATPVLVLTPEGVRIHAQVVPPEKPLSDDESDRLVLVKLKEQATLTPPLPVVFDLMGFTLDGDTIRMRALDDLAGCGSILAAFERVVAEEAQTDIYVVFTRAEEGGLFGARLMAEAETLPKETLVVSVESSPVIPGVTQGEGPVIRTGDRAYTFDAEAEQVLIAARDTILQRDKNFKSQRQLLSGGMCEATAFAVFGYRATGIAFPLGNYHNGTTNLADPNGGVGAEYIKTSDYLGGVELIAEAAKSVAKRDDSRIRQYVRQIPDDVRKRLEAGNRG